MHAFSCMELMFPVFSHSNAGPEKGSRDIEWRTRVPLTLTIAEDGMEASLAHHRRVRKAAPDKILPSVQRLKVEALCRSFYMSHKFDCDGF